MRFLISENKKDQIIDFYITKKFEKLNKSVNLNSVSFSDSDENPILFIETFVNYEDDSLDRVIFVSEDVYKEIYNMFSMSSNAEIQNYLIKWFNTHMGIETVEVSTF